MKISECMCRMSRRFFFFVPSMRPMWAVRLNVNTCAASSHRSERNFGEWHISGTHENRFGGKNFASNFRIYRFMCGKSFDCAPNNRSFAWTKPRSTDCLIYQWNERRGSSIARNVSGNYFRRLCFACKSFSCSRSGHPFVVFFIFYL